MTIRFVRNEEFPQLLELYQYLNVEDPVLDIETEVLDTWNSIMQDQKLHCFVVEEDSKLVGSCMLAIIPNLTRSAKPFGVVQNVITHPDYRGRGIGSSLLQKVNEFAWENNCYQILLQTGRKETHDFYRKAGYRDDIKTGFVAKPKP